MSNFKPLEVVDRDSETQHQVVANLNKLIYHDAGPTLSQYCLYVSCLLGNGMHLYLQGVSSPTIKITMLIQEDNINL